MSFPKRFGRSVTSSYVLSAAVGLAAVVMTPVLVRGLGKEGYGVWALASALALYFKLLEFGVGKAIPSHVAEHSVDGDDRRLARVLSTAIGLLGALAALAALGSALLVAFFPQLFSVSADLRTAAQIAVAIVLLDLCVSMAADAFGWTLIGLQRFDLINATLTVVVLAQAIAWGIVIAAGGGLVPLAIVTVAISLAGQLVRYRLARRLLPSVVVAPRQCFDRAFVRPFLRRSSWIGVTDVATIVAFRLDVVVVGLVLGVPAAAVYAVGQKLTFALEQLTQPTTKAFFPHASELAARRDIAGLQRSLILGTRMSLLVAAPLALVLAVLAQPIVDAWVGSGFDEAGPVIVFLACAAVIVTVTRTGLLMLQATTEPRTPAIIYGAEALLNLVLSVGLALAIGVEGVALGTLIASALGAIVFLPFLCSSFDLPVREFLAPLLRAHLPPAIAALGVAWLANRAPLDDIAVLTAAGAAVVGTYLVVFLVTGLDRDERRRIVRFARAAARRRAPAAGAEDGPTSERQG